MPKELKVTKSIIKSINSNYKKSNDSRDDAIKYAIKVGEGLMKAKEKVPHGEWQNWVQNPQSSLVFSSMNQVQNYMKLAKNKHLALAVNDGTIDGTCKAIANASDEDKEFAEKQEQTLLTKKAQSIANQMSSESKEWYTDDDTLSMVFEVMGDVDLDPCSDPDGNVAAKNCFTQNEDGLLQDWHGRVFMNPPYCGEALNWCEKLISENPEESITLVPSNTDTNYFHKMIRYSDSVCFIKGRLEFKPGNGSEGGRSTVRNVLFYKGVNKDKFKDVFTDVGFVI